MKLLTTLSLSFFLFGGMCLTAQNTTTWFPPGARWSYSFGSLNGNGEEYFERVGQEMVGGEMCEKLHYYGFIQNWVFIPYDEGFRYFFARNDSVFLWNGNSFDLLYDFNRKPCDVFSVSSVYYDFGTVQQVGDTIWNGIPVRYQDLRLGGVQPWAPDDTLFLSTRVYERLGGTHLIYWNIESPLTEIIYALGCYSDFEYPQVDCPLGFDPEYESFPQTGVPVWSEKDGSWCSYRGYQYKVTTDTIINGVGQGKKVYFRNTYKGTDPCPIESAEVLHEQFRLIGLLKQDIQHEQVYFARLSDDPATLSITVDGNELPLQQFTLLYDFKLRAGDTVFWKPEPNVVQAIGSIQLDNGSWRRTIVFDSITPHFWIEGIGSNFGLLGSFANTQITDQYGSLQCYRYNNQVLYSTVDAVFCDSVTVATQEPNALDRALRLFPNPSSGMLNLEIPEDQAPAMLRLFDLQGRELERFETTTANRQMDLSTYRGNGVLLLQIRGAGGQTAGRVLRLE